MNPYDPHELDRLDPELDRVARQLEEHAAAVGGEPPLDLPSRVWAAIETDEPPPASRWAWLAALRRPARGLAAAAVLVAAVTGALAIGSLIDDARPDVGGPSAPEILPSPSETPSPEPSVSPSPTVTSTPSSTPRPTPSDDDDDDDEVETPEPTDGDSSGPGGGDGGIETPEPTDGDNSGPGGGGSSGSGSAGEDNSGPGGGG